MSAIEHTTEEKPFIVGGSDAANFSTSAANYRPLFGGKNPTATITDNETIIRIAGVIKLLTAQLVSAAGAGKSVDVTLYVNNAATALTLQIAGASDTEGSDLTHQVQISKGDKLSICTTPTGTPTASRLNFQCVIIPHGAG